MNVRRHAIYFENNSTIIRLFINRNKTKNLNRRLHIHNQSNSTYINICQLLNLIRFINIDFHRSLLNTKATFLYFRS